MWMGQDTVTYSLLLSIPRHLELLHPSPEFLNFLLPISLTLLRQGQLHPKMAVLRLQILEVLLQRPVLLPPIRDAVQLVLVASRSFLVLELLDPQLLLQVSDSLPQLCLGSRRSQCREGRCCC